MGKNSWLSIESFVVENEANLYRFSGFIIIYFSEDDDYGKLFSQKPARSRPQHFIRKSGTKIYKNLLFYLIDVQTKFLNKYIFLNL